MREAMQYKEIAKWATGLPRRWLNQGRDFSSVDYWEKRYIQGGTSGVGSYGKFAHFKADVINEFLADNKISSVIEFGCGDGNQLLLAKYPYYLGVDVSEHAIQTCRMTYANDPTKHFALLRDYKGERAELALSLDVIYHLVEDEVYEEHLAHLFFSAERYVIIYSSNTEAMPSPAAPHIRHRKFTDFIFETYPEWRLLKIILNRYPFKGEYRTGSFCDFYIYEKY